MENFSNNAEQIAIYQQSGDVALRNEIVLNNMVIDIDENGVISGLF